MLKEERQKLILEQLKSAKKINFADLSNLLTVSYDSIRRDVIELEDKGLLKKVHGGIVSNSYLDILGGQRKGIKNGNDIEIVFNKAAKLFHNNRRPIRTSLTVSTLRHVRIVLSILNFA